MCEKGIGYAVRVALLGHYCMVVHHDEEGSDGQNCGLGSYLLSAADMIPLHPTYVGSQRLS